MSMGASVNRKNGVLYTVIIILAIPVSLSVYRDIRQRAAEKKGAPVYLEQMIPVRAVPALSPEQNDSAEPYVSPASLNLPGGAYDTPGSGQLPGLPGKR